MRGRDPAAKALIFTQFHSTLSWLSVRLQQEGYGFRTISGSMPLKKRAQVLLGYTPLKECLPDLIGAHLTFIEEESIDLLK